MNSKERQLKRCIERKQDRLYKQMLSKKEICHTAATRWAALEELRLQIIHQAHIRENPGN